MSIKLPDGYSEMDGATRQQAFTIALANEIDKLLVAVKNFENLESRIKELEAAREVQKKINAQYLELKKLELKKEPLIAPQSPKKGLFARLLNR